MIKWFVNWINCKLGKHDYKMQYYEMVACEHCDKIHPEEK